MNKNVRKWPCICQKFQFWVKNLISLPNFHAQQTFHLKTTINHANERYWLIQIQSFVLTVQFSNKHPHLFKKFSTGWALVLNASIHWPTPTYEFYISVIQKQRYSNLQHYFDHSAKFGRFYLAKYNTMNKNVRKWPCICRKFGFWVNKVHFIA